VLARDAERDIESVPAAYRSAVVAAIDELGRGPMIRKPLRGRLDGFTSLRVGAYRIVYRFVPRSRAGFVVAVRHRSEAYRYAG